MSHHHKDGECECCKNGIESMRLKQEEGLKKYGWFAHFVSNDPDTPYNMNIHTHGLKEGYGHRDIQICMRLPMPTANSILGEVAERIKKGEVFEPGKKYSKIIKNYDVIFVEAEECERPVLRIILPNVDGSFEGGIAQEQLKGTK